MYHLFTHIYLAHLKVIPWNGLGKCVWKIIQSIYLEILNFRTYKYQQCGQRTRVVLELVYGSFVQNNLHFRFLALPAQTRHEEIECTKGRDCLRFYCPNSVGVNTSTSLLETNAGIFRLFMKGKFDVLWTFGKKIIS